ncbi:MAG: DedA family protein [bacterium]
MLQSILNFLDPLTIIKTVGLLGVVFVIFAESGLFFGFFLPGDSLLFTAGFLASQGFLNIYWLVLLCFFAAVLGDNFGYWFGRKIGPKIFNKEESIFFHKRHIERAQNFYEEYGNKTILLARFIPIVRTFAPIVAGVGSMKYKNFIIYNLLGGFIWTFGVTLGGYSLGQIVPNADRYIFWIILAIIILSIVPIIFNLLREKKL